MYAASDLKPLITRSDFGLLVLLLARERRNYKAILLAMHQFRLVEMGQKRFRSQITIIQSDRISVALVGQCVDEGSGQ